MTEFAAFVQALLTEPDGAGAFADWLDERGDPRAVLLRRRWRRWQKDRWAAVAADERARAEQSTRWGRVKSLFRMLLDPTPASRVSRTEKVDATFVRYIRRKFASETPPPPAPKRKR